MHPHPSSEHPSPGKRDKQVATMIGRSLPLLSGTLLIVSLLYLLVTFAATHGGAPASGFLALYCIYLGVLVLTGSLLVRKQWLASLLMSSLLLLFSLLYFILPSLLDQQPGSFAPAILDISVAVPLLFFSGLLSGFGLRFWLRERKGKDQ